MNINEKLEKVGRSLILISLGMFSVIPFLIGFTVRFFMISVSTGFSQCPEIITDFIYGTKVLFGMDLDEEEDETSSVFDRED